VKSRRRSISVFSISALDLFAAALGAFILIVLVLFPYYKLGGTDVSMEELEDLVQKRRMAAATTQTEMAQIRAIQADIWLMDKQYKSTQDNMSTIEAKIREVLKQTSDIQIPDPPPVPKPDPKPEPTPVVEPPRSVGRGVEFSILGLSTSRKDIAIVVDMSGSMRAHSANVTEALNEIVAQMKPDNRFVIIGYRGGPTYDTYPSGSRMASADAATIRGAQNFIAGLPSKFGGGTPTQNAMIKALNLRPQAVILISDGQPDDGQPTTIVRNVTNRNRGRAEIHTVAIGRYTDDKNLTLFLQAMAEANRGDFVGRAR